MRSMHHIAVDRGEGLASYRAAVDYLRAGEAVGIFPEATISRSMELKEFKTGAVRIAAEAGVPDGIYTTLHGLGEEAGAPLVQHPDVAVISFTGSCDVGRWIAAEAGRRMAKVCLELGGKNPLIVCDDADLDLAVTWTLGSAFSNAGQRCAAGSRILVFDAVYDAFKAKLVAATQTLSVGTADTDDFGPVINEEQLTNMLAAVARASSAGAVVLTGGTRLTGGTYRRGYFVAPTLIENVRPTDEISTSELFGPLTCLYRVSGFEEAIAIANGSSDRKSTRLNSSH